MRTQQYAYGTSLSETGYAQAWVAGKALCSDGKVRTLKRIAPFADTFFSVSAAVSVWDSTTRSSKTVTGFITTTGVDGSSVSLTEDKSDVVVVFTAYEYRKNGHMLPGIVTVPEQTVKQRELAAQIIEQGAELMRELGVDS